MILNIVLLYGLLINKVFCLYSNDTDGSQEGKLALRFSDTGPGLREDTMIRIYFFAGKHDKGIVVPSIGYEHIIKNIDKSKKAIVMFNGHPTGDSEIPFKALRVALLDAEEVNIFFVFIDWTKHHITFLDAMKLSVLLGLHISEDILHFGIDVSNCHFIAHCVGAEIGTLVAKNIKKRTGVKIPRMTVFDPYIDNYTVLSHASKYVDFIDVYHAGIHSPPFAPIGNVDFYPNAGVRQPGCTQNDILTQSICHHQRSVYLYLESIYTSVQALEAHFNLSEKNLRVIDNPATTTFGHMVNLGRTGAYYLPTYQTRPYLMNYF